MKQTFILGKGEITFEEDKIIISDDAKRQKFFTLLSSIIWIIYGTMTVLKYSPSDDLFLFWFGLLIAILYLLTFVFTLFRTSKTEVFLTEVKSIKVKRRLSNKYMDIKLKNNRLRRVIRVEDVEELEEYIKAYCSPGIRV